MTKHVEPSTMATAFSCPHCGTLTSQTWSMLYADRYSGDVKRPPKYDAESIEGINSDKDLDEELKEHMRKFITRMISGEPFFDGGAGNVRPDFRMYNLNVSECYECQKLSIWLHDRLLFPALRTGIEPNNDLEDDIKRDFDEARSILDQSPRGAAALLRLALQKLCKQLGESGDNIDADIASLVGKGLNPVIQRSLDVVRVVGNESVHPGTLDLRDDRDIAVQLLKLINSIAEQMISHPKHVNALYDMLPEVKRAGIDVRNAKAIEKAKGSP